MIIKQYLTKLINLYKSFQWFSFAKRHHYSYLALMLGFGLAGYAYLLLFPMLAVVGLLGMQSASLQPLSMDMLSACLSWFALMVFSIGITHHIFSMRFPAPMGVVLKPEQAPRIFSLVADYTQSKWLPKIGGIIITEHFELDIRTIPGNTYPHWPKKMLIIGLPLLQSLSEAQVANLLQRKCLQYKLGSNLFSNWLYQCYVTWPQYASVFRARHRLGDQLIAGFFQLYAPAYRKFAAYAMQQRELNADRLALAQINDVDLFKTIQAESVYRHFFNAIYLPKIRQTMVNGGIRSSSIKPYAGFPAALRKVMTNKRIQLWLEWLLSQSAGNMEPTPALQQRMDTIGHNRLRPPPVVVQAAAALLAPVYTALVPLVDIHWARKTAQLAQGSRAIKRKKPLGLQLRPSV